KNILKRKIRIGVYRTARDAYRDQDPSNKKASYRTITRSLHQLGFNTYRKVKKPFLSSHHKKARLAWAKDHKHWTMENWKTVVWSDETKIDTVGKVIDQMFLEMMVYH